MVKILRLRPARTIKYLEYLSPMQLYALALKTGKNMIGCDLGEAKSGVVVHLCGSMKVLPIRGTVPSEEPFLVIRHDPGNPNFVANQLSSLADRFNAAGYVFGYPADSRCIEDPNNGRGVKEALFRIDQTGILAGKIMTLVNEKNTSKRALSDLKSRNPHINKSQFRKSGLIDVAAAQNLMSDYVNNAATGTLYVDDEDVEAGVYLEGVVDGLGIRRRVLT